MVRRWSNVWRLCCDFRDMSKPHVHQHRHNLLSSKEPWIWSMNAYLPVRPFLSSSKPCLAQSLWSGMNISHVSEGTAASFSFQRLILRSYIYYSKSARQLNQLEQSHHYFDIEAWRNFSSLVIGLCQGVHVTPRETPCEGEGLNAWRSATPTFHIPLTLLCNLFTTIINLLPCHVSPQRQSTTSRVM